MNLTGGYEESHGWHYASWLPSPAGADSGLACLSGLGRNGNQALGLQQPSEEETFC